MKILMALIAFIALPSLAMAGGQEYVILIHGLGRTPLSMKRLEWNLRAAGYQVINLPYPSRRASVAQLSESFLAPALAQIPQSARIHFVTHSLGGILVRQYLADHPMTNLGRVVMLAPPSQGSELSDSFRRCAVGRWILGPAGCELGTATSDVPHRLGPANFDVGVIAGDRSLNPLFSLLVTGPSDGKVSVERSKLPGMRDFLVVHHSHTWMMCRRDVLLQTRAYLETGAFGRESRTL
jgi:pimeloyl-ACP methyl ester carboxylesterase